MTKLTRRTVLASAATFTLTPAVLRSRPALAAYPDRPVKIIVANSPGGPSDIIARIMAAALQEATGGSFIVENRGGGGGNIGMGAAARSEPDGYTLLLATSAYSVNPASTTACPTIRSRASCRSASLRLRRTCSRSSPTSASRR